MFATIVISACILLLAFVFLGIRILFVKNGKFPNTHIGANKAMKERGIHCATTQDREMQKKAGMADVLNKIMDSAE